MKCKDILIFLHIYKNAGTTIKERYRKNKNYIFKHDDLEKIFLFPDLKYIQNLKNVFESIILAGHAVKFNNVLEENFNDANISYVTTLREPLERIVSAYNYYKFKLYTEHNIVSKIDIIEWFIIFKLESTIHLGGLFQYELFLNHIPLHKRSITLATEVIKKYNIKILFTDDKDWLNKFDNIVIEKNINCNPKIDEVHSNTSVSRSALIDNISINDLTLCKKNFLLKYLKDEYIFYNNMKEKYGNR
ncbi:MAG: hypothetical protein CMQ75_03265 [Gammaproteobacteria bacterium]|nr:hypothetical protein [Gammaproteobacteria bacterium]|tara:strand:+ start:14433 stop:15170 length:738 start_codon:yes stop_codon:yes gene_type:complete